MKKIIISSIMGISIFLTLYAVYLDKEAKECKKVTDDLNEIWDEFKKNSES